MNMDTQLFVVGPVTLQSLNAASQAAPALPWGETTRLEAWSDDGRVFLFTNEAETAAFAATALAEVMESRECPLTAGEIAGPSPYTGTITSYRMDSDGNASTRETVTLTYEDRATSFADLLDLEIMEFLEVGEEFERLHLQHDDSSP